MSFVDPAFLFAFLPITLILFYTAGRWLGRAAAMAVLTVASILFCVPFGWRFTVLMLASAAVNAVFCRALAGSGGTPRARKWLLYGGVAFNLGLLAVFKYWAVLDWVPAARAATPAIALWVPITISFYTFQRLVLLIDCHRREPAAVALVSPQGAMPRWGLPVFLTSFPNLTIGPIAYASEVAPQLASRRFGRVRRPDIEVGLTLFAIGLAKKVLIADVLAMKIVNPVFDAAGSGVQVFAIEALVAILGCTVQIYFDFSGYSDMALGAARMFGIRLPYNFYSPLRATGIIDFYRRWHISLTRVVARLLFQPLSIAGTRRVKRRGWRGWRAKPFTTWLPLLVNFLVIGIWHDAAWTFVAFGLTHGLWFILETEMRGSRWFQRLADRISEQRLTYIGMAITFLPLALTFALFRSGSIAEFQSLIGCLWQDWRPIFHVKHTERVIGLAEVMFLAFAYAIVWLMPNAIELLRRYRPGITTFAVPTHTLAWFRFVWRPTLLWGLLVAVLLGWTIQTLGTPAPFIYAGF